LNYGIIKSKTLSQIFSPKMGFGLTANFLYISLREKQRSFVGRVGRATLFLHFNESKKKLGAAHSRVARQKTTSALINKCPRSTRVSWWGVWDQIFNDRLTFILLRCLHDF
jgi:hypothetical protein